MAIDPFLVQPHVPRLLEVHEVAYQLKCSQETVRRLIRTKQLAAIQFGSQWRVRQVDLDAFIEARRVAAEDARDGRRELHLQPRASAEDGAA